MEEIVRIVAQLSVIFCSLAWMFCSFMCYRTYMSMTKLFSLNNQEIAELKTQVLHLQSFWKGQQKTSMNHNDRIDRMTSQIVRLMNEKEITK